MRKRDQNRLIRQSEQYGEKKKMNPKRDKNKDQVSFPESVRIPENILECERQVLAARDLYNDTENPAIKINFKRE
jgi:hypothetical protein